MRTEKCQSFKDYVVLFRGLKDKVNSVPRIYILKSKKSINIARIIFIV